MTDFKKKFYDITSLIQVEFDRNMDMYGEKIQCRRGCSKCCSQIFRITQLDGWMISQHIKQLPEARKNELQQKAKEYISLLSLTGEGLPCPALGTESECTICEARPVICRRFGMPIYDYKNPQNVHACELNFKDGDEITDDKFIPNQTEIGMKWDELKDEFSQKEHIIPPLIKGGQGGSKIQMGVNGTTIAEAIAGELNGLER
ncbi:MAG: YkgJ family cysteine cluster protein [Ignavibacteria bacterium]|nr:YkgJ family cysteine cluster protein [Ignavibacteria bacterium]